MSIESAPEGELHPRTDLVSALVWIAIGLAIAVYAWRMDRLANLHINKYEAPGLVPGLLGAAITLLGIGLALRSIKRGALRGVQLAGEEGSTGGGRAYTLAVLGAMLVYTIVLVGHGLPFWLVTAAFVSLFIFFFDRERQAGLGRSTPKQALLALVYGVATSAIVSVVFQDIFYVRLP
jgi:hypothetical protein